MECGLEKTTTSIRNRGIHGEQPPSYMPMPGRSTILRPDGEHGPTGDPPTGESAQMLAVHRLQQGAILPERQCCYRQCSAKTEQYAAGAGIEQHIRQWYRAANGHELCAGTVTRSETFNVATQSK